MLIPVDGPGLVEMTSDLQSGQPMEQDPDDGGNLTSRLGTEQASVLRLGDELADGGHGVIGSLLQPGIRFGNRSVPEDQLVVMGALYGVVDVGLAAGAQPLPCALVALRAMTNPSRDLPQCPLGQGAHERCLVRVVTVGGRAGHPGGFSYGTQCHRFGPTVLKQL